MSIEASDQLDFKRDRWGRPLIVPRGGGKPKPYTRSSSAAKTIEDTFNLELWSRRNVAYGMSKDASLVARVLAIGGDPKTWDQDTKTAVNKIVEEAQAVAKAHESADIGTAVHAMTHRLDLGEQVDGGPYEADLVAYRRLLDEAGLETNEDHVECRMVCDALEMAGTADRIVRRSSGPIGGRHAILDIKTGATVEFGGLGWAAQLAAYANGELYDVRDDSRPATPAIDTKVGYILHLPAGQGRAALYEIDLVRGFEAAKLANEIRATRKASKSWLVGLKEVSSESGSAGASPPTSDGSRRAALLARFRNLGAVDQEEFRARNVPKDDLDAIERALDAIDPFVGGGNSIPPEHRQRASVIVPDLPVGGPQGLEEEGGLAMGWETLIEHFGKLPEDARKWVHDVIEQGRNAGVPFNAHASNGNRSKRRFEIYRALINLAPYLDDRHDEVVRQIVATVLDSDAPFHPIYTVGKCVGALDLAGATEFARYVDLIVADPIDTTSYLSSVALRPRP